MTEERETIFVFGSNLAGRHGRGSAKEAVDKWGAQYGIGWGRTGKAYAIPTKDSALFVLPLHRIRPFIATFLLYAREHPELYFQVVSVGCGLAGYKPQEIAPMFRDAPLNVQFTKEFEEILKR
jgi:hypothetical protein